VNELLLGIDVGTTFCKAAVVDLEGAELAHAKVRTPWERVPTGAESHPQRLLDAALTAAREAIEAGPGGRVLGIGVTSMAETGALLDRYGEPVAPAIAWHDSRGRDQAARLAEELGERFVIRTGLPASALCTLSKYRWLAENHPAARSAARWLNVSEWVVRGLCGQEVAELSLASRTGFLGLSSQDWWDEALAWAGVPAGLLPEPAPAGTEAGRVRAGVLPGAESAAATVAGHDHLVAAVGAGAAEPGEVLDSCGTAEALVRSVEVGLDPQAIVSAVEGGVTVGCHVVPERWALLGAVQAGMALERFLALLGVDEDGRSGLDAAALEAPHGAGGLRARDVLADHARLEGIASDASPEKAWRAALEAVALEVRRLLDRIEGIAGLTTRLVVTGGWATGSAPRAVKRAILGGFDYPPVREAGARGAALLGGVAAGLFPAITGLPAPGAAAVASGSEGGAHG
jgi:sugar (pentulose or hexulose) kinase